MDFMDVCFNSSFSYRINDMMNRAKEPIIKAYDPKGGEIPEGVEYIWTAGQGELQVTDKTGTTADFTSDSSGTFLLLITGSYYGEEVSRAIQVEVTEERPDDEETDETENSDEKKSSERNDMTLLLALAAVLVVITVLALLFLRMKRKKSKENGGPGKVPTKEPEPSGERTLATPLSGVHGSRPKPPADGAPVNEGGGGGLEATEPPTPTVDDSVRPEDGKEPLTPTADESVRPVDGKEPTVKEAHDINENPIKEPLSDDPLKPLQGEQK